MSLKQIIRRNWREIGYQINRFRAHFQYVFAVLTKIASASAFIASIACIVAAILLIGLEHDKSDTLLLRRIVRISQIVFIIKVIYNIIFNYRETRRTTKTFKWIADFAILITLLPLLYPHPEHPWLPWLEHVLYNNHVIFTIVGLYSVVEFCYGILRIVDRRINPTFMLATSFIFFIIIGSFVLMLPKCTVGGIKYIDSLFVSTSAVCITGLSTVDISATFTPFGLLVLSLLIQIGGLGVMTFTSFFALFFSGNTSVYSQLVVKDMIYSKTINSLLPTLLYILGFTVVIELIGAVAIFLSIHSTLGMSLEDELIFSGFHSLSGFCNAGFSNIEGGLSNPALLNSNQSIYIIASVLIFLGGIGFPILVNFKTVLGNYFRRFGRMLTGRRRGGEPVHIYDMNTKIVMKTTSLIFLVSAILFFILESDNSLAGMSLYDKIVQSVFNAFVPRSSGFASVNPAGFLNITIIMMIVLMWIGGASQSTAGGIKVNTFSVMLHELKSVIKGRSTVVAYHRTIAPDSIRRANAVLVLSIIGFISTSMLLVAFEPHMSVKALLFESASALFTVGSSLGITADLSEASKILLCIAMFLGRVGILSLLIGFFGQHGEPPVKHPVDNVIIN